MPTRYKIATQDRAETFTNKIIGTTNLLSFNAPQGFLINGKIVVSVATDNLTVALKGLNGENPSATNPVYVRINNTVRSITSVGATSRQIDAGTNWFLAGSTELATKEMDYFVYLVWNAVRAIPLITISRIPYARIFSDFTNGDGTAEKSCYLDTTDLAAGDDVELIGRFAATLSAGAGYTWTVPTFTTKNLIQRPIYSTRKLIYQNTLTGTGFAAGNSVYLGKYQLIDSILWFWINFTFGSTTTYGTANDWKMYLPFTIPSSTLKEATCSSTYYDSGTADAVIFGLLTQNNNYIYKYIPNTFARTSIAYNSPITWATSDQLCFVGSYSII